MNNLIYLVGFMGSGKTTIGNLLAKKIGSKSIDLDDYIVTYTGKNIPRLFEDHGEAYFRQVESDCLEQVGRMGHGIVCTGGGIVKEEKNRTFLKGQYCMYLSVEFEELYARIANDPNRPLAQDKEILERLYNERKAWYEEVATYTLVGDHKTPLQVVNEMIQMMK